MIQHRGSLNNFFINSANKFKNKQGETQPRFILNLKKLCVCFSKQQNNEKIYLKKPSVVFVINSWFLLIALLVDFITLIIQKIVKTGCFICKNTIKKKQSVSKKARVFIKNTTCFFYNNKR